MAAFSLFAALQANALQRQDNSIGYTYSSPFTEPGVSRKVTNRIVEYVHPNGCRLGNNLFRAKAMRSDENDPRESSDQGATGFPVLYGHLLSLGALKGGTKGFGPVGDVGLTAGFDVNTKNDAFGPRKQLFVGGPTLQPQWHF